MSPSTQQQQQNLMATSHFECFFFQKEGPTLADRPERDKVHKVLSFERRISWNLKWTLWNNDRYFKCWIVELYIKNDFDILLSGPSARRARRTTVMKIHSPHLLRKIINTTARIKIQTIVNTVPTVTLPCNILVH